MLKDVIIWRQGWGAQHGAEDGVGGVVERVRGDQSTPVNTSTHHKLNFRNPFFHSFRFRLGPLVVLFKIVRKISIQIEAPCVVPGTKNVIAHLECGWLVNLFFKSMQDGLIIQ